MNCKHCGHSLEEHESDDKNIGICHNGSGNGNRCVCPGFEPFIDPDLCDDARNKDKLDWAVRVLSRQLEILDTVSVDMATCPEMSETEPLFAGARGDLEDLLKVLEA